MAVITISRQYGAGGKTLGQKVARKLGYYFAEDDIIQMVAREAKVSRDWVECIQREAGSTLLKFMQEHYKLSLAKAKQVIDRREKRRINLYRKFGRKDYDQPHLYHLVLNMSQLDLKKALKLICALVEK